jgi:hypothetical protein
VIGRSESNRVTADANCRMKGGPWVPAFFSAEGISPRLPHTGRGASIALYRPDQATCHCSDWLREPVGAVFPRTLTTNLIF